MKFDVVIGNPPYQEEREDTRARQIYPFFMESSFKIATISILITPARFLFDAGDTSKSWNKKMLNDSHFKIVSYTENSKEVFTNTDIKGGVAISYRDTTKIFEPIIVFIPYKELRGIVNKIERYDFRSLANITFTAQGYKLSDSFHLHYPKEFAELPNKTLVTTNIFVKFPHIFLKKLPDNSLKFIKIHGRTSKEGRTYRWVDNRLIEPVENFNNWKVLIPKSMGSGIFGEPVSRMIIGKPEEGHTQTFMSIGSFSTELESRNCLKYIKTKFARLLLGVLKVTQDNPPNTWQKIPIQDFTKNSDIDWSKSISEIDEQLYKKYGLDEDEIKFIEDNVKEME